MSKRDMLLYGMTEDDQCAYLQEWYAKGQIHRFVPDYHRLQLERWLWERRFALNGLVMDVGVETPRRWIGDGYFTVGLHDSDVVGDLLELPLEDESIDNAIVTEVLEHCEDPQRAVGEVYRVLKPAGMLLVTSPFIWPWHGTNDYPDYWRFTAQAWMLLLRAFINVKITPCAWTPEGEQFYDMMRRFECMGLRKFTTATTGYLVEAMK